ncbi:MAG: VOC family protein [Alphaproteobacteria bacterium]|nr:VOC family protein [Alphaproteobacteria bacterium]
MSVSTAVEVEVTPPAVMFSHFGINCDDADKLEDFYTRVLGFCVSDHGMTRQETIRIVFMTRRPREHHQFVLASGRSSENPPTVGETGFKAPDLAALRHAKALVEAEAEVSDVVAIDHGISWTLYFRDPESNRCAISVETGHYVPQPAAWPLDLSASDANIRQTTEARCKATSGYMSRADWRAEKEAQFRAENRLTDEGPETGNADPDFERPNDPDRILLNPTENSAPPPQIAQSHCGFKVADMDMMVEFYDSVLGYAVTGRGIMPAISNEPAREYAYLSRDPDEHHQVILVSGRDMDAPTSVNQLSLRILSLDELRRMERELEAHPAIGKLRNTCHGNSFSIYFPDPEGNVVELAVESVWYVPAPHGAPLDLSWSDQELIDWAENHCRNTDGFMMRADWKSRAREELIANGHLEAEGLVSDVA